MIIIHPDGKIETKKYKSFKSIGAAVNPPGRDDPFTTVPLVDGYASGYTVFANDNGMLIPLPRNSRAEDFTGYPELYGPICIASFEESGEDDLKSYIVKGSQVAFEKKLSVLNPPNN